MNGLITTLRVAMHLSAELASQRSERRAQGGARTTPWSVWFTSACLIGLLYALFGDAAWAATSPPVNGQTADFTLFDTLEADAENQSNNWFNIILGLVRPTFLILATIEICWAAAIWAFEKDNLNSLAVEIIKKIMFIGFFFSLLQFAPEWVPTIAGTFVQVGETATGQPAITTDGIIATGLAVIKAIWAEAPSGFFNVLGRLGQILVACFVTLGVIIAYVVIAAQYFTLKIESYILFAAGAIFLGLGSSSWTKEYVSKYLNYAITVGVRLLVMILILSLMLSAVTQMGEGFVFDYVPLLKLLAVAILQAILGVRAPEMAGALLSGGIGLSAGTASGAGSSAMGGLKTAMGGALGAVAKGASAVQGANNFGKAVAAGRALAEQNGKSGGAAALSGLGNAMSATAKAVPGKLMNALKGGGKGGGQGGGQRGQNPGVFAQASKKLQEQVKKNNEAAGGGSAGGASGGGGHGGSSPGSKSAGGDSGQSSDAKASDSSASSGGGSSSTMGSAATNVSSASSDSSPGESSSGHSSSSDASSPSESPGSAGPGASSPNSSSASASSPSVASLSSSASSSRGPTSAPPKDGQARSNKLRKAAAAPALPSKRPSAPRN